MAIRNRIWILPLLLVLTAGLVYQASQVLPDLIANRARVQALRVLLPELQGGSIDEMGWETGWRSLCSSGARPSVSATGGEALSFVARTAVDRGDYAGALEDFRRVAAEGDGADAALARAYVAALEMRWQDAAKLYPTEPTPRHQRFWATIYYLAAQDLVFHGQADQAAEWYRKADQGYGTQGPLLGLSLMECLVQAGRPIEAFDAYRRALVVLPVDEALAHRERFERMRLEALQAWHAVDPANRQVTGWLAFYEGDRPSEEQETLASEPQPQVSVVEELGDGRTLIGFDYRKQDIETGPFMWVDLYLWESTAGGDRITRSRRAVLNQAPNGSFAWDAVPDGVRPFGWHGLVYLHNLDALETSAAFPGERGQCMNAGRIGGSFGLQSLQTPLGASDLYLQGGQLFAVGPANLSLGRQWYGVTDPYNYSYVGGRPQSDQLLPIAGVWERVAGANQVAVWLLAHADSQGCFNQLYLFKLL